jgi:hypothetical protein
MLVLRLKLRILGLRLTLPPSYAIGYSILLRINYEEKIYIILKYRRKDCGTTVGRGQRTETGVKFQ